MFYFAGHGHTIKHAYGEEMGYIIPVDAPNPNKDREGFLSKAVDMQMVEVFAKRIQSKHAMFLFDSCFSGSIFALSRAVPESISYKTAQPVRQFITSGSADETVPDKSIFLKQFVSALSGEADMNKDGYVTGTELGEFLQDKVVNYSKNSQHPQYGKIRNPHLDKGDFVFQMAKASVSGGYTAPLTPVEIKEPSGKDFKIDDLEKEAKEIEKNKAAWGSKLKEMKQAYSKVKTFEQGTSPADRKAAAWQRFLKTFNQDNPYSQEDDTMFQEAEERINHWNNQQQIAMAPKPQKGAPTGKEFKDPSTEARRIFLETFKKLFVKKDYNEISNLENSVDWRKKEIKLIRGAENLIKIEGPRYGIFVVFFYKQLKIDDGCKGSFKPFGSKVVPSAWWAGWEVDHGLCQQLLFEPSYKDDKVELLLPAPFQNDYKISLRDAELH